MSGYKLYVYVITPAMFFSFSLNTWLFLEQSNAASKEYDRQLPGARPERSHRRHRDAVNAGFPNAGGSRGHPSGILSMEGRWTTRVKAPAGMNRAIFDDSPERMFSYCRQLLTNRALSKTRSQGRNDAHQPVDNEQSAERVFQLNGTQERSPTMSRADPNRNKPTVLKHSILLRTDDNRTTQSTPWGLLPDECSSRDYGSLSDLPSVSVIICFHENEIIADVLHTVHSVVQRTPQQLIREILLIDDYSKKEDFKQILDKYVSAVFAGLNVRVIRSEKHSGLIQCRLHGARLAKGDALFFMDSHMEVQPRWLEPLLWELKQNPATLASSYLDWMKQDEQGAWSYTHGASSWKTYFDWNFVFGFQTTSQQAKSADLSTPVSSPVTVGGVFAILRTFFFHVGAFDEGMWGWGGENLDLPIRVWLFGGRVVNVPCSHVGHTERYYGRSYRLSWQHQTNVNYMRVTKTWLLEYEKYIYYYNPSLKTVDPGDLTSRLILRNKTSRTFRWILENVFPELGFYDKNTFAWDGLRNLHFNSCLWARTPQTNPVLTQCNKNDTQHQGFFLNELGELRFPIHVFNAYSAELRIYEYITHYNAGTASRWIHWPGGPMQLYPSNQCLEATEHLTVVLTACDRQRLTQRWRFNTYSDKLYSILRTKPLKKNNYYWYTLFMEYIQTGDNITMVH